MYEEDIVHLFDKYAQNEGIIRDNAVSSLKDIIKKGDDDSFSTLLKVADERGVNLTEVIDNEVLIDCLRWRVRDYTYFTVKQSFIKALIDLYLQNIKQDEIVAILLGVINNKSDGLFYPTLRIADEKQLKLAKLFDAETIKTIVSKLSKNLDDYDLCEESAEFLLKIYRENINDDINAIIKSYQKDYVATYHEDSHTDEMHYKFYSTDHADSHSDSLIEKHIPFDTEKAFEIKRIYFTKQL